jgi:secreted PhoX family phosphatase
VLRGVDNVTGTPGGDIYIAEDGGDMQLVLLGYDGSVSPFLQVIGQNGSEITGPAFSPAGDRVYFSSQRGGPSRNGITYEVTGPFRG